MKLHGIRVPGMNAMVIKKKKLLPRWQWQKKIGPLSNILYEKSKSIENWAAIAAAAAQMKVS